MSSLLDRKRSIDAAKAKQLADEERKRKETEERRHPLLKMGASRYVRDAYFLGLVFAAFANDERMDSIEEKVIRDIGCSFEMSDADIDESIAMLQGMGNDEKGVCEKLALIEECVKALKRSSFVGLFVEEFEKVWQAGQGSGSDLQDFKADFERWTKVVNSRKSVRSSTGEKRRDKKMVVVDDGTDAFGTFDELMGVMAVRCDGVTDVSDETFAMLRRAIMPFSQWPVNWMSAIKTVVDEVVKEHLNPHAAAIKIYCAVLLRGLKTFGEIQSCDPLLQIVESWLKRDWSSQVFLSLLHDYIQEHLSQGMS